MDDGLRIENLEVKIGERKIIDGFSLHVPKGAVHAIMGPNGTGKSSLSKALLGHPEYAVSAGSASLDGKNIVGLSTDEIARMGLFLSFQYPVEINGVSIANFIRACIKARLGEGKDVVAPEYYKELYRCMDLIKIDPSFTARSQNV